jgi:arsenite transporter
MQLGLFIYFLAPCTDWFLGFTRAAKGDTAIGALLVPINMLTQILLYPFYIYLFTNSSVPMQIHGVVESLGMLFVLPLCCALIGRYLVARYGSKKVDKVVNFMTDEGVFLFLFVLIFVIFVSNIGTLVQNAQYLPMMILAIIIFFITSFFIAEFASKFFNISHPKKVLLTFTTAARNSQLMLGITAALFPGQPLLYAAIIIGLLVEFPHLIIITQIFINKHRKQKVVNID